MSIRTWPSPPLKAQAEAPRRSQLLALSWALGCPPRPHAVSSVPRTSCGQISMHGAEWGCDSPARHSGPEEVGLGTQAFLLGSPLPGPLPAAWHSMGGSHGHPSIVLPWPLLDKQEVSGGPGK